MNRQKTLVSSTHLKSRSSPNFNFRIDESPSSCKLLSPRSMARTTRILQIKSSVTFSITPIEHFRAVKAHLKYSWGPGGHLSRSCSYSSQTLPLSSPRPLPLRINLVKFWRLRFDCVWRRRKKEGRKTIGPFCEFLGWCFCFCDAFSRHWESYWSSHWLLHSHAY